MAKGNSKINNPFVINTEVIPNNRGILNSSPTIHSGLSSAACKCCFQRGGSWFCYLDVSKSDLIFYKEVPGVWGLPEMNNDFPLQPICVDMIGEEGEPTQQPLIPPFNVMQYVFKGRPYTAHGVRSEKHTFTITDLSNEEKYPYTISGDIAGFEFPQFAVSQARKIPASTADTLCGPVICLSGSPEPIGYAYDRMNYNWFFGQNAGIAFQPIISGGTPLPMSGSLISQEGCAVISNEEGELLFYTNGETVWTSGGTVMVNGTGLSSSGTSTQSVIIVPQPDSSIYLIFTTDFNGSPNGFEWSSVDMSLQGGDGQIGVKNFKLINDPVSEKVTACCHGNEDAYWVITHTSGDTTFYSYKVSASGLHPPITTNIGSVHNTARGYMKTSPDGNKLVSLLYDEDIIDIFDYNTTGGTLSNFITLTGITYDIGPYGLEFSSDSSKFYVSDGAGDKIYQFDLSYSGATDMIDNSITLPTISGITGTSFSATSLGALQMGADEKIYVADRDKPYLHTINYPNGLGINCNLQQRNFSLTSSTVTGVTSEWGLPNVITCKALSCDRSVYISPPNRLGYEFQFVFNNINNILQDPNKKLTFIGEFYPRIPDTLRFSTDAIVGAGFDISHEDLITTNTHSVIIPTLAFPETEILIKGYWQYGLETFTANQLGFTRSSKTTQVNRGDLYDIYTPDIDWYFINIKEAEEPLFNNSVTPPPSSTNSLVVYSQITEEGVDEYPVNTIGQTLVALGGSVLATDIEYSAVTTGVTPYIKLLIDVPPNQVLTVAYIEGTNPDFFFADLYRLPYDPKSGPTDGEGNERVWYNTTTGYYEYFLKATPASDPIIVLNGAVLSYNIEYSMSISNPKRIIFYNDLAGNPIILQEGNILQAFYEATEPAIGKVQGSIFELPFYILKTPSTLEGLFIAQFASDEDFEDILYEFTTPYLVDEGSYSISVNLVSAKAGDTYFWRIINLHWYVPIIGNTICTYKISGVSQINVETNIDDAY